MNETQEPSLEVLQPSALHALERAQIDTQVATAHQYPRSIETFRKRALGMATLDEDTAESCIYVRPVGKEQNDQGKWVEKYAEGPSIRMAEIVGCSYGNLRVASRIIEQTDRFVKCEGVCHDLESNYAGKSEIVEATVKKDGTPYSERQRALVAKVALAKAYRDAIFKVVPRALCKPVLEACKKITAGQGKPLEERRKKAAAWIGTLKIDEARVFAALGVNGWADVTNEHLTTLIGLRTAIADGDPIDEIFPPVTKTPEQGQQQQHQKTEQQTTTTKAPGPSLEEIAAKSKAEQAEASAKAKAAAAKAAAAKQTTKEKTPPESKEKAPEKAPETVPGTGTVPPGENKVAEPQPDEDEQKALREAGLTPDPTKEQAPSSEPPPVDPWFAPTNYDTEACTAVKKLAIEAQLTGNQLRGWLVQKKLCREGQKLSELSDSKLTMLATAWANKLPEIKGFPK